MNGWLHIPSTVTAEGMAHAGYDSLTLDLQHGLMHFDGALPLLKAISTTPVVPLARVPWNEPGIIMKMLDAGCYGVICPMVNTRAQCEAFVGACRYPPHGYRSFGPTRALLYGGADYPQNANQTVLSIAMIETAEALDNLDEILSVSGLDGIYVGPADLSQSFGGPPGADFEEGPVPEALETILQAAKTHGIVAGIHNTSVGYAQRMVEKGFSFVTINTDLAMFTSAARGLVERFRGQGASRAERGESSSLY